MKTNDVQKPFTLISGPCSLESYEQIASYLSEFRPQFLRAGIFKMRTSHQSFQGMRKEGIQTILKLKEQFDFKLVSEVVDEESLKALAPIIDIFQVGARNMYNYELLKKLDQTGKQVLLKRAFSATLNEWLEAAQYIKNSEQRVLLCERGIRTFETSYRNVLDLNAIVYLKKNTNYKVFVDPSHACGKRELVADLSFAALAAGADGLIIESHPTPEESLSDARQAIDFNQLDNIRQKIKQIAPLFNCELFF